LIFDDTAAALAVVQPTTSKTIIDIQNTSSICSDHFTFSLKLCFRSCLFDLSFTCLLHSLKKINPRPPSIFLKYSIIFNYTSNYYFGSKTECLRMTGTGYCKLGVPFPLNQKCQSIDSI